MFGDHGLGQSVSGSRRGSWSVSRGAHGQAATVGYGDA